MWLCRIQASAEMIVEMIHMHIHTQITTQTHTHTQQDHNDIKMPCHLLLTKITTIAPAAVLRALDKLVEPLQKTLTTRPKSDAVKQEVYCIVCIVYCDSIEEGCALVVVRLCCAEKSVDVAGMRVCVCPRVCWYMKPPCCLTTHTFVGCKTPTWWDTVHPHVPPLHDLSPPYHTQLDRHEDMLKSCLRAIDSISRIDNVSSCVPFQTMMDKVVMAGGMKQRFKDVQRERAEVDGDAGGLENMEM